MQQQRTTEKQNLQLLEEHNWFFRVAVSPVRSENTFIPHLLKAGVVLVATSVAAILPKP